MEIMMHASIAFNLLTSMTKIAYLELSNHEGKKTSTATVSH